MYQSIALGLLSLAAGSAAQGVGTNTAEVHPKITYQTCAAGGTCTTVQSSIVLDANWRWVHTATGYTNCFSGNAWDATLCPTGATCAKNCVLDGADYTGTYGIKASGNSVSLQLATTDSYGTNIGSRVYVMDSTDKNYQMFKMLNKEITMDVDVSKLPCGLNGAVYFTAMQADGGKAKYPSNTAGAAYGTGYCDAQCPQDIKFINGEANVAGWASTGPSTGTGNYGTCCPEMDLWEANSISTAYTPHPCSVDTQTRCTGADCGNADGTRYQALCDKDGCDFNSYRWKNHTFYGPGMTVDTGKVFTVVTQFITDDNTATGTLSAIKRFYVQGGKVIPNSYTNVKGIDAVNAVTKKFCNQQKKVTGNTNSFKAKGGLAQMGKVLGTGMVLVLSLWDDNAVNMLWLDSTYPVAGGHPGDKRGTCATTSGVPADVEKSSPGATVVYSNIKVGPIGSTFKSK